jgi:hypothetical protein
MSPSGVLAAPPEGHLSCQQPWDTQHVCTSVTQFYRQRPIALAWNQADYLVPHLIGATGWLIDFTWYSRFALTAAYYKSVG